MDKSSRVSRTKGIYIEKDSGVFKKIRKPRVLRCKPHYTIEESSSGSEKYIEERMNAFTSSSKKKNK